MANSSPLHNPIRKVSTSTVKPPPQHSPIPPRRRRRIELTPWDLSMFNANYIQKGHLFSLPSLDDDLLQHILTSLQSSLSLTLLHFYPLAGRLATSPTDDGSVIYIDCTGQGAEFSYAVADGVTVSDVEGPRDGDLPSHLIRCLFPYNGAINHDGHVIPLLAVQVTRLVDGVFVGCNFNHVVGDGTTFWHFFNTWAEICRGNDVSRPPLLDRWFPEGTAIPIQMPFRHPDEFIERFTPVTLRERMFHFSGTKIAALKAQANRDCNTEGKISSFQALSALLWRAITRARHFPEHQKIGCRLAIENRSRLRPPLSPDCVGNSIYALKTTTTVGELLSHNLGWVAMLLNKLVASHDDNAIRGAVGLWLEDPMVYKMSMFDLYGILMGSSPRFDMYGCEFGWGKAMALRSGPANKFDGKVSAYPGREGGGSIDLEVCLLPEYMRDLVLDDELMSVASATH